MKKEQNKPVVEQKTAQSEQNPEIQEQFVHVDPEQAMADVQAKQEQPKKKYKRLTPEEQAAKAAKAKAKREAKKALLEEAKRKLEDEEQARRDAEFRERLAAHWDAERAKIENMSKETMMRNYRKFNSQELRGLFGGWFTLTYAFSVKNKERGKVRTKRGVIETDYWICSQDVSMTKVNERPPLNTAILNLYGKEVYGFAIIAPSSAFCEGTMED